MRYPLDPECPIVVEFMESLFGDPTMAMGAPVEDITEEFERRHRKQCKRCQEYGVCQRVTECLPTLLAIHSIAGNKASQLRVPIAKFAGPIPGNRVPLKPR